ncbi:MAG: tRNA (guanosine(37)-N1)-methyltransferase TrmD [Candidatus Parcubacteria bacterium]|nr:tRNA (guanosine(37)-N1)-methyltransferase TrmD [Candidatus Parcubacteria bacterium]
MIRFDIITIFPEIFESYFKESLLKKAIDKGLIEINIHNLRDFTSDKHHVVDDKPFGGGIGMVMKIEPIFKAVKKIKKIYRQKNKKGKSLVVLFTPRAKKFSQKMAYNFSKIGQLILICGRYEGIDERVAKYIADKEVSIGDYVLMGGELPAMIVIETISRLIPGIIGKPQFLKERITSRKGFIEYPQYTRPEVFSPKKGVSWKAPKVLLGGNHKKVEEWRNKKGKIIEN